MDIHTKIRSFVLLRIKRHIRSILSFRHWTDSMEPGVKRIEQAQSFTRNVLIIIENMSYTYDTRVQNIAKSLLDAGYLVNVICPRYQGDPRKTREKGLFVHYYYLPPFPKGFAGHLAEYAYSFIIISILSLVTHFRKRVDVLQVCNPPDFFFPLGKVFQLLNSRFIYDKHDRVPELYQERFGGKNTLAFSCLRKAEDLTERIADHIILSNESGREKLLSKKHKIIPNKITVVRNGPELGKFPEKGKSKPDRKNITVGYVGNMNPQDCIDLLLNSVHFIKFVKKRTDLKFVLIGDGSAYAELRKLSRKLRIEDIIEFTGRLSPEKAYRRLSRVHICIQPDRKNAFTDTCTMVKDLEYMALGKPIVAFDLNETRYSCGDSALYASNNCHEEFAEKILNLADNPKLRSIMGERGRKRLHRKFTWLHSEKKLLKAYKTVMK